MRKDKPKKKDELGINEYQCVKDGGEFHEYECQECCDEQLVYDAEISRFHCLSCDANYTTKDLFLRKMRKSHAKV